MVCSVLVQRGEQDRNSDPLGRQPIGARPHFPNTQRRRTTVDAGGWYRVRPTGHFISVAGILFAFVMIANSQPCTTPLEPATEPCAMAWPVGQSDWHPIRSCGHRLHQGSSRVWAEPRYWVRGLGASALKSRREFCAVLRITAAAGAKAADETGSRKKRLNDDDAHAGERSGTA
jgi:hypothetical protein